MQYDDWNSSSYQLDEARLAAKASMDSQSPEEWVDRFGNEPRKGADIVVQCLEREGAHRVFAYPGGASMEIHQALTRSNLVKNTLCRHEQVRSSWHWLSAALWARAAGSAECSAASCTLMHPGRRQKSMKVLCCKHAKDLGDSGTDLRAAASC